MGKAFSEIVADCRLVNEMEMIPLIMLPLIRVTIEIGLGMLSCSKKFQKGRSITGAPTIEDNSSLATDTADNAERNRRKQAADE